MSRVIWNFLLFHWSRLFISFSLMQWRSTRFWRWGKVMILISKIFRRLLNLFDARNFNCAAAEVTQANFKTSSPFVYLLAAEIFFAYGRQLNVSRFRCKSAEWARNFVVCSPEVSVRITLLLFLNGYPAAASRRPFRLPVWNFGRPKVNRSRRFWQPDLC